MKRFSLLLLIALLVVSVVACTPAAETPAETSAPAQTTEATTEPAAPATTGLVPEVLEVQLIPSRDAAKLDAQRAPLQGLLEKELGMKVNVTVATDYNVLIEAMKSEKVHVGFLAPASYVLAADQGAAEVILVSTRFDVDDSGKLLEDQPLVTTYKAQLVVGKDSGIKDLAGLKGKKIAIASFTSTSGFVYPANLLVDNGFDIEKDVEWINVKGHDKAIEAVYNGTADAAFTFKDARDLLVKDYPDVREKVVFLQNTAPIQNDTISVIPNLDAALKDKIKQAFINITKTDEGHTIMKEIYSHEGYAEATDSDFAQIRDYLKRQETWEVGK